MYYFFVVGIRRYTSFGRLMELFHLRLSCIWCMVPLLKPGLLGRMCSASSIEFSLYIFYALHVMTFSLAMEFITGLYLKEKYLKSIKISQLNKNNMQSTMFHVLQEIIILKYP